MPQEDILAVKREKLSTLQKEGRDPFQITKYDVTHHAQEIKDSFESLEGQSVRVMSHSEASLSFSKTWPLAGELTRYAKHL